MKQRYSQVRSKNHSCNSLRKSGLGVGPFPVRSIIRLGSTTETEMAFPKSYGKYKIVEVNTTESIRNSRSKLLMKQCFSDNKIKQSNWWDSAESLIQDNEIQFPILAKRVFGFKGKGMVKIDGQKELNDFLNNNTNGYYFEKYFSGQREYRLHIAEDGCFMSWRKLRKKETPDDKRWYFNSDFCNWAGEDNDLFNKPNNWKEMIDESVKALKAVGLDIGCVDLRCQGSDKKNPDFIIVEVNSAPALAEKGIEAYREKIYDIINDKIKNNG